MMRLTTAAAALAFALGSAGAAAQDDGTLDPSFAGGGAVRIAFDRPGTGFFDEATAVAVQPDGKIVVAGTAEETDAGTNPALVRLNANGAIDPSFGGGPFTFGFPVHEFATDVLIELSGSILVAVARLIDTTYDYNIYRWSPTGVFETAVALGLGTQGSPMVKLAFDPISGKVLAACAYTDGTTRAIRVVRLEQNLSLDPSYGPGGWRDIQAAGGLPTYLSDLAVMPDGRLVIGGYASVLGGGFDFLVARLTQGGTPDSTFGTQGQSLIPIDLVDHGSDIPHALAVDSQGRTLLCGSAAAAQFSGPAAVLIRVTAAGGVDPGFNGGEPLVVADTNGIDRMNGVVVQSDGRIVVAGGVNDPTPLFFAARFWPDGAADWSFGSFGIFAQDFPGSPGDDSALALALQGGRPILVGGAEWSAPDYDFGVMRLASSLVFSDDFERGTSAGWSQTAP